MQFASQMERAGLAANGRSRFIYAGKYDGCT